MTVKAGFCLLQKIQSWKDSWISTGMGIASPHLLFCTFRRALICDHTAWDSDSGDAANNVTVIRSGFQSSCLNRHTELKREMVRSVSFNWNLDLVAA